MMAPREVLAYSRSMTGRLPALDARRFPRQARSLATVDVILEAATRVLERDGLPGFNTNAVAERAGVSVGSLYQYFPGKEALLASLIRQGRKDLLDAIEKATLESEGADLAAGIDACIAAALRHQFDRPGLAMALEQAEALLPIDAETQALGRAITACLSRVLAHHGIADALIAAQDIAALSRGMIDEAGRRGETDALTVKARVKRAVMGYLASTADVNAGDTGAKDTGAKDRSPST